MQSVWDKVRAWLNGNESSRRVEITHGGDGGKWYVLLIDQEDADCDGTGDTVNEAVADAWNALEKTLVQD